MKMVMIYYEAFSCKLFNYLAAKFMVCEQSFNLNDLWSKDNVYFKMCI